MILTRTAGETASYILVWIRTSILGTPRPTGLWTVDDTARIAKLLSQILIPFQVEYRLWMRAVSVRNSQAEPRKKG